MIRQCFARPIGLAALWAVCCLGGLAQAQTYYWTTTANGLTAGSGTWGPATPNWSTTLAGDSTLSSWASANDADFYASGTSTVTVNGNQTVGNIVFDGSGYTLSGGTLNLSGGNITANQNATITSAIGGDAGLVKNGAGALTLFGSQAYSGATTIANGTLRLAAVSPLANPSFESPVTAANTNLYYGNMTPSQQASFGWNVGGVLYGGVVLGAEVENAASGLGFGAAADGAQACVLQADAWISQTVNFSAAGVYPLTWSAEGAPAYGTNPVKVLLDGVSAGTYTPGQAAWSSYTTSLNVTTAGTHTIEFLGAAGVNNFYYMTAIDNISLPTGGSLPAATILTVSGQSTSGGAYGTFDLGGISQTVAGLTGGGVSGGGTTPGTITNNGGVDAVLTVAGTSQFDGVLADGATNKLGLAVSGGSLTLTGPNTYTGPTTINAGTLQIGAGGSGESLASPSITMSNNATLAFNHSDSLAYVGTISGSGGLVKSGGGTLTLLGGQTYSGAATIANGTLRVAAISPMTNASFESPVIAANSNLYYGNMTSGQKAGFAWAGGGDWYTGVYLGPEVENAASALGFGAAAAGAQACVLQANAWMSQTVNFSAPGIYPLTWSAEGAGNGYRSNPTEVLLDGVSAGTYAPGTGAWTNYTTSLNIATAGTHTIEFLGTEPSGSYNYMTAIDNVSLPTGGPLPATTVLTVSGQSTSGGAYGTFDLGGISQTVAGLAGGGATSGGTAHGIVTNNGAADGVLSVTGTSQFDGVLADGATNKLGLAVSGGSLTLTGPNTYTGPTTVNAGTLQIGAGGSGESLASPSITMSNNATLAFNHSDSLVYSGSISGSGDLVKNGGGALTLAGNQTYSGATVIANGTLRMAPASLLANPSFESPPIASGTSLYYGNMSASQQASFAWTGSGVLYGGVVLGPEVENAAAAFGFGAAAAGAQACILQANASITQTVNFSAAGVYPLTWSAEGASTGAFVSNPTEVLLDGVAVATYYPGQAVWSNYTTSLNVATAGTHTIEFLGATGAGAYDNMTAIDNVSLPTGGALPATTVLTVAGQSTGGGPFGTFDLGGLNQTVAGLSGGGVSNGGTAYGTIANSGTADAVLTVAGTSQFDGVLADGATNKLGLAVSGGSLTLTGPNTYTGPTTVNAGTLQIGAGGSGESLASPSITMSNNATLAFNHSDSLAYVGAISGSGCLVKNGGGELTLFGSQTYSGVTTIANGTLRLAAVSPLANPSFESPIIGANSSIYYQAMTSTQQASFAWAAGGNPGYGPELVNGSTGLGINTPPAGVQTCVLQASAWVSQTVSFSAAGVYSLAWSAEGASGTVSGVPLHPDPTEVLLDGAVVATYTPGGAAWSNYITSLNVATAGTHTIEFLGTKPETNYSYLTAIDNVSLPTGGALPATTVLTVAGQSSAGGPSGIFDLGGLNQTVAGISGGGVSGGGTTPGTITNNGGVDAVLTVAGTSQFDGVLADGATNKLGLAVSGGSLTLTGPNTYTGPTTISAGTLQVANNDDRLPTATALTIASAGVLDLGGNNQTVGSLSGSTGAVVTDNTPNGAYTTTLTVNAVSGQTTTFAGNIIDSTSQPTHDSVALVLAGDGELTLSGTNAYSGGTTISGGTLVLASASALPSSGLVTIGSGGWLELGGRLGHRRAVCVLGAGEDWRTRGRI